VGAVPICQLFGQQYVTPSLFGFAAPALEGVKKRCFYFLLLDIFPIFAKDITLRVTPSG
jgi:hypothetical protein